MDQTDETTVGLTEEEKKVEAFRRLSAYGVMTLAAAITISGRTGKPLDSIDPLNMIEDIRLDAAESVPDGVKGKGDAGYATLPGHPGWFHAAWYHVTHLFPHHP